MQYEKSKINLVQ